MAKVLMKAQGFDADVELLADRVVITRKGLFNAFTYGFNSKTEIPITAITEVSFKPPLLLGFGSIDFIRGGRATFDTKRGSSSAVKFRKSGLQPFGAIKEKVFELMNAQAAAQNKPK
jgi:hypothetical protein